MGGTLLNALLVFLGSAIGMLVGDRLPQRIRDSVMTGLGIVTFVVGMQNAFVTGNIIVPLLAVVIGVIIGEVLRIDQALDRLGTAMQARFAGTAREVDEATSTLDDPRERFVTGFVTASLVFCVGPLTIIGSLQDGMGLAVGFQALAIKSVLDFFASMAFAATFGLGVMFTVVTVLVVQGGLALVGMALIRLAADPNAADVGAALAESPLILELTAVGGLLLIGLALLLLDLKQPRIANFLPALAVAPLLVWLAGLLGIPIYPL